jgi:hypothetical protein
MTDQITPARTAHALLAGESAIDLVARHWASLPRMGHAPERAALDATTLAPALPFVFIAELVTPRVARLRLTGHKVEEMMDMDVRGMPLTALFTAAARPMILQALEQVSQGARAILPVAGEGGFGQPGLTGQLALFPLADGAGQLTRVMGVIELDGVVGRTPRRLCVTKATLTTLPPLAPVDTPRKGPMLRVIAGGKA